MNHRPTHLRRHSGPWRGLLARTVKCTLRAEARPHRRMPAKPWPRLRRTAEAVGHHAGRVETLSPTAMKAELCPDIPFYVNDWLSSAAVNAMTLAEQGAYFRLLCLAWNESDCTLPRMTASWPACPSLVTRGAMAARRGFAPVSGLTRLVRGASSTNANAPNA